MIGRIVGGALGSAIGKQKGNHPVAGAVIGAGALFAARRLFPQRYAALAAWAAPRFLRARSAEAAPFQCAVLMLAAYSFIDGSLYYAHSLALFFFCCAAAIAVGMPRGPAGSGEEPSLLQTESER